jgi:DnaJ domain
MRDPYECLAVPRSATAEDIKRSFRQLAKKLHPDANNNDPKAAELFAELNAAYAILGNWKKRSAFDRGTIDAEGKPAREAITNATRRRRFTLHVVTCLLIAVLMPVITLPLIIRSLTPQDQINPEAEGKNAASSGFGSNGQHAGIAQSEKTHGIQSEPHLILQQMGSHRAGDVIALGVKVVGQAVGVAVELSGLPTGMTISAGRPQGAGRWRILATDLDNAVIRPPQGFGGAIDLTIELRLANDFVVDRGSLHREWLPKPTGPEIPIVSSESQLDQKKIKLLVGHGQKLLSEGDLGTARVLWQRAANAGDVRAALALNATYDPIMLSILQAHGVLIEDFLAPDWYNRIEFGSQAEQQGSKFIGSSPSKGKLIARPPLAMPRDPFGAFVPGTSVGYTGPRISLSTN